MARVSGSDRRGRPTAAAPHHLARLGHGLLLGRGGAGGGARDGDALMGAARHRAGGDRLAPPGGAGSRARSDPFIYSGIVLRHYSAPFYGEEAIHGMAHPKVVGKYRCPTYEVYAAEIHEKAAQLGMRRQEVEQALWVAARTGYLVRKDALEHALQAPIQPSAAIAAAKAGGTGAGLKRSAADAGMS